MVWPLGGRQSLWAGSIRCPSSQGTGRVLSKPRCSKESSYELQDLAKLKIKSGPIPLRK
jgi:hypothetical protein